MCSFCVPFFFLLQIVESRVSSSLAGESMVQTLFFQIGQMLSLLSPGAIANRWLLHVKITHTRKKKKQVTGNQCHIHSNVELR